MDRIDHSLVAALIGCETLIKTCPSRSRQAQREPGAQHRDKREAREFGFRCGHGFRPRGGWPRVATAFAALAAGPGNGPATARGPSYCHPVRRAGKLFNRIGGHTRGSAAD